jgi:uncharacterized protein YodC (DUF2158 family)
MPKTDFKIGDIVRLKSGGPDMTIVGTARTIEADLRQKTRWSCSWFGGKKLEHGSFPSEALDAVTPKTDVKS